jgi:excisionase family DNA binding protein
LLHGSGGSHSPRLRTIDGGGEHLLSVRQVAKRLNVSTATVYKLCERGELMHLRVSNAIRVTQDNLAAFTARQRKGKLT